MRKNIKITFPVSDKLREQLRQDFLDAKPLIMPVNNEPDLSLAMSRRAGFKVNKYKIVTPQGAQHTCIAGSEIEALDTIIKAFEPIHNVTCRSKYKVELCQN